MQVYLIVSRGVGEFSFVFTCVCVRHQSVKRKFIHTTGREILTLGGKPSFQNFSRLSETVKGATRLLRHSIFREIPELYVNCKVLT